MKKIFLLVIGLSLILVSGCGEQEPPKEPPKSTFEKIQSGELSRFSGEGESFLKEVCLALSGTPKFDSSARREILKDYGVDLASIARIEQNLDVVFLNGVNGCPMNISFYIKEPESSGE